MQIRSVIEKEAIQIRWNAFCDLQFPTGCVELDPNGVCLALTDTYTAGCITSYLSTSLSIDKRNTLKRCRDDLALALDTSLPDHIQSYFLELQHIANAVLAATD